MRYVLFVGLLLTGCEPGPVLATHTESSCSVQVEQICGVDGSHPVSPSDDVLVELVQPSVGWDAWIEGVPSVSVREPSGDRVVVRPDHPLEPGQDYTLWVRDCHGGLHPYDLPVGGERE